MHIVNSYSKKLQPSSTAQNWVEPTTNAEHNFKNIS